MTVIILFVQEIVVLKFSTDENNDNEDVCLGVGEQC